MNQQYLQNLKNAFQEGSSLNPEDLKDLLAQNMQFIQEIQGKLASDNEEDQQKAMEAMQEVRSILEGKLQEVLKSSGLDVSDLMAFSEQPQNIDEEKLIKETKASFERLKGVS